MAAPDPREFSPIDTTVLADRIRRANEQIVPAHSHTSASARFESAAAELDVSEGDPNAAELSAGSAEEGTKAARTSSLRRSSNKKPTPQATTPGGSTTPGETLRRLSKLNLNSSTGTAGFKRFKRRFFADNTSLFSSLQQGQAPKTLLIGCCDSRCDPAIITDCDPGDLFVIRNVSNLVPPYSGAESGALHGTSAAMEFAVKALHVTSIIVLGHTQCGGINALLKGDVKGFEFLESWMQIAQGAKDTTLKNFGDREFAVQQRACEHASILTSLQNLTSYPWIRDRLANGEINITGWYFDFKSGDLLAFQPDEDAFVSLMEGGGDAGNEGSAAAGKGT
ncbi:hypothetical protein HDU87_000840 [Geranomyces variabilis]|uniref:Carbonic anhydrase n=1 Tax=Geranomyces variabilis TaxID=109894 RepID=A0AAD5TE77_9FUNG|nr:hypothetical protein HDU87_000840 [Geranomyces variabilis]